MIPRRFSRVLFLVFSLVMVFVLYSMLQSVSNNSSDHQESTGERVAERLDHLEESIRDLDKSVKEEETKQKPRPVPPPPPPVEPVREILEAKPTEKKESPSADHQCTWRNSPPTNTTFEIRQLYDALPFDDQNGGVWKQGFEIEYRPSQWTSEKKLKIILMPHSHCDPGWIHTFEGYFKQATKFIIDTVITVLDTNPKYKFIWAEMSYLSLWWDQASAEQRQLLKKVINSKQLEIVTGGWVMNDEANTHYFAMLDQLIEGHQFIENNLGNVTLRSGWANDPFGYSPTMAYLLQGTGMQYMAIQRVHYHIKKALAKDKRLEFLWQQSWDRNMSTRILTHVMPFYSYDVPHTCGPDPKVCCQFDFRRAANSDMSCPWGVNPVVVTDENVRERAELLLDQYRKKAQLYRTNVLFVQLGDDFRYVTMNEAKSQYENYDRLMTYMNKQTDWHVDAQFGTLTEFFEELVKDTSAVQFPSYMGDFFTYADRADHYWSGYYTSRQFFKRMDRIVESYLRAGEILFSMAHIRMLEQKTTSRFPAESLFNKLVTARRNLGIFQHHDGITGTAKEHVVNDYGDKLLTAITSSQTVMEESAGYLLYQNDFAAETDLLRSTMQLKNFESLPSRLLLSLTSKGQRTRVTYVYNPTDQRRVELVKFLVDTHEVYVTSNKQRLDACQIEPKWTGRKSNMMQPNLFELLILVDVEAYSLKEYTIHRSAAQQSCPLVDLEYLDERDKATNLSAPFKMTVVTKKIVKLENRILSIHFSKTGSLLHVERLKDNDKLSFTANVVRYGTSAQSDHNSGAYLFLPDGDAKDIPMGDHDLIRIQRGPLISRLNILHAIYGLEYKLTSVNASDDSTVGVAATAHLTMNTDTELALRFTTVIKSGPDFFTDLNGFQVIRRKTYDKLPLQGNVYPMPTMAYIEDDHSRFTVLSGQPSGVASLKSGVMDVFLDRRLLRDDNRGLGHGVTDNREILSTFKLLFEARHTVADRSSLTGYPTLLAHHQSMELLYPLHTFQSSSAQVPSPEMTLFAKGNLFPGDYHLVNLRTLNENRDDSKYSPSKNLALILRRFAYDCDGNYDNSFHWEQPVAEHFFPANRVESLEQTSLSLRHIQKQLSVTSKMSVATAELMTYKIKVK